MCPGVGWGQPGTHIVLAFNSPSLQGRTPSASGVRGAPELGWGRRLEPHAPGDGAGSGDSCPCFTRKTLTCPNVVWDCLKLEEGVSPKDRHAGWVIPAPRRCHLDGAFCPPARPALRAARRLHGPRWRSVPDIARMRSTSAGRRRTVCAVSVAMGCPSPQRAFPRGLRHPFLNHRRREQGHGHGWLGGQVQETR